MGEARRRKQLGLPPRNPKRIKVSASERKRAYAEIVEDVQNAIAVPFVSTYLSELRKIGRGTDGTT